MKKKEIIGLHVLTDRKFIIPPQSLVEVVRHAINGGASAIQLRDKTDSDDSIIALGKEIMAMTMGKIPLIVNDRVNVAVLIGAQGLHVGQDDMPARQARKIIGDKMILGVSASTVDQAKQAERDGADYIGAGPVFLTTTKTYTDLPIGLSGLENIKRAVSIPVIAIGGINEANAKSVAKIADGIAVISAVMGAKNPLNATQSLSTIIRLR